MTYLEKKMIKFLLFIIVIFSAVVASAKTIELTASNTVVMVDAIEPSSTITWAAKARQLDARRSNKKTPLYVLLSCPGGTVVGLKELKIAFSGIPNLHTIILSASSACAMLPQYLPGTRYITEDAQLMYHLISMYIRGGFYNVEDIKTIIKAFDKDIDLYADTVKRSSISLTQFITTISKGDWVMGTKEALDLGFADEVVDLKCGNKSSKLELFKYQNCLSIGDDK